MSKPKLAQLSSSYIPPYSKGHDHNPRAGEAHPHSRTRKNTTPILWEVQLAVADLGSEQSQTPSQGQLNMNAGHFELSLATGSPWGRRSCRASLPWCL